MRSATSIALLLLLLAPIHAANNTPAIVELYQPDLKKLSPEAQTKIVNWTQKLLKTSNFNTANGSAPFKESVASIQHYYRKTVRNDYLVVSYPQPKTIDTAGGAVTVSEIVVGLARPSPYGIALITIDPEGRVVEHGKWTPFVLPKIGSAPTTANAR